MGSHGTRRPPAGSGAETAGLVVIAALPLLASLHLAAAQLAARVGGHPPLRAGLVDALVALVRLASTPRQPKLAWPPESSAALPGPVPYWFCIAIVVAVVGVLIVAGFRLWHRLGGGRRSVPGRDPHPGLGTARDLRILRVRRPVAGRLTLGRVAGQLMATEPQVSLAVIGPTGCGKTAGFAIPALLEWAGPVICTSVKTDLIRSTIRHRSSLGKTWVFDPSGATVTDDNPGGLGTTWSPLGSCSDWGGAIRMADWLCEAAQPRRDTVTDKDYWYSQACKALGPHLEDVPSSVELRWQPN